MLTFVEIWFRMAESLSEIFFLFLAKQQIILERYNAMKDKLQISQEENEALKKENEKQRQLIETLEMDKDFLQMARQIAPDREALDRSRAMIARLVRDVDKCIEQLKD